MSRNIATLILASVLMLVVMAGAIALALSGLSTPPRWISTETWSIKVPGVDALKRARLLGKSKTALFVSTSEDVRVYDSAGSRAYEESCPGGQSATLGDLNADGIEELIILREDGRLSAVQPAGRTGTPPLWETTLSLGGGGRILAVAPGGIGPPDIVAIDKTGKIATVNSRGASLWTGLVPLTELRGLDVVRTKGAALVVIADRQGSVVALSAGGAKEWSHTVAGGLRRMRTFELLRGQPSTVVIGAEEGYVLALDGQTGATLWQSATEEPVTELRSAELDGQPDSPEVVSGGKRGEVTAWNAQGQRLFRASVGGKVTEIASVDFLGKGVELLAIGTDSGTLSWLDSSGTRVAMQSRGRPISRLLGDTIDGSPRMLVADAAVLSAIVLSLEAPPGWVSPIVGGVLACLLIAVMALVLARQRPAPRLQLGAEAMSIEAQKARRLMLREALADLEAMKAQVPPQSYQIRQRELRSQLLDVETHLTSLGAPQRTETLNCPHCGGSVLLGADRCEYCGRVVLT